MKIKQRPEDFVVEEVGAWASDAKGQHAVYRLAKRGIGTLEAIDIIARMMAVTRMRISFGGLKDRHSASEQLISVHGGPARDLDHPQFRLKFLGRSTRGIDTSSFTGNTFNITIRDLSGEQVQAIQRRLDEIRANGVPNYYDDQRFGSLRGSGDFIARHLLKGDFETALKLAIASPSAEDQKTPRAIKKTVQKHWGNWKACKEELPRSSERSIATYLVDHPTDFAHAYELLNQNLRILYLSAYQSYLWNLGLCAILKKKVASDLLIPYPFMMGPLFLYRTLPAAEKKHLLSLTLPLMTKSTKYDDPVLAEIMNHILKSEGITHRDLRIKGLVQAFFSKGQRRAVLSVEKLDLSPGAEDELNHGRRKITLAFELPRGSYATILIKRLTYDMETRRHPPA